MGQSQTTKQDQQYNSKSTYDFLNPPDTGDIKAYRGWNPQMDPSIGARLGGAIRRYGESFMDPRSNFAGQTQQRRSFEREMMATGGEQARAGAYDVNQQKGQQLGNLAALTSPRLVQTAQSGTQTGTSKTTQPLSWMDIIQGGVAAGGAF
jgi:hypothetical protein